MFFSKHKEKIEEYPIEFLHKPKTQRKKKQYIEPDIQKILQKKESLHTTESIISEKVKKYLTKLFKGTRFTAILENSNTSLCKSSSICETQEDSEVQTFVEDPKEPHNPTLRVCFPEEKEITSKYRAKKKQEKLYQNSKKFSSSFRKSYVSRKLLPKDPESLTNLYKASSSGNSIKAQNQKKIKFLKNKFQIAPDDITVNVLKNLKSNSFCEIVDQLIKKQKKKQNRSSKPVTKKLKKTTKSSISTMCDRAKLLLYDSFIEEIETTDECKHDVDEDVEQVLTIHDLNNFDSLKSSEESLQMVQSKSMESIEFISKCRNKYNCSGKVSSCTNLHHSSQLERPMCCRDFEADLELWTADYVNGLVAVNTSKQETPKASRIPVKKKCKSVKTKSKKSVKSDVERVKDDTGHLTGNGRNSHLLGGVRTMEGGSEAHAHKPHKVKTKHSQRRTIDAYACQKVQDIQNYIDNLILPVGEANHKENGKYSKDIGEPGSPGSPGAPEVPRPSAIYPQKQSIQELKKFQRELRMRIKELEKKIPANPTGLTKQSKNINSSASDHALSFINGNKQNLNSNMKFGDKFCECCFLNAKRIRNDICRRCNKKVYIVEKVCAGGGVYHKLCYNCYCCKRSLNSLNLCVTRGEIFCSQCFKKYFGPEVYGFVQ